MESWNGKRDMRLNKKIMKITLLILLVFNLIGQVTAQSFQTYLRGSGNQNITHSFEKENGNFLLLGSIFIYETVPLAFNDSYSFIYEISDKGTILDSLIDPNKKYSTTIDSWNSILPFENDFFVFGTKDNQVKMARLNQNLDTIWYKTFGSDTTIEVIKTAQFDKNGNIVLLGNTEPLSDSVGYSAYLDVDFFIYKISTDGDSLFSNYWHYVGYQYASELLIGKNDKYYIFNFGAKDSTDTNNTYDWITSGNVMVTDLDGNIDTMLHLTVDPGLWSRIYYEGYSAKWLTDETFIFSTTVYDHKTQSGSLPEDLIIDIRDTNNNVLYTHSFGGYDTTDWTAGYNSLDFLVQSAIYAGGTSNDIYTYNYDPANFRLIKFDSTGQIKWEKQYKNGNCNRLNTVMATKDGGCLLIGSSFDYLTNEPNDYDAWMIKVGPDGNLAVGIDEKTIVPEDYVVYPNPVKNMLTIRIPNSPNTTVKIFDTSGKELLEKNFSVQTTISTANFESGVYLYQLTTADGKTAQGKFVKI
jgi:hypothetical protein